MEQENSVKKPPQNLNWAIADSFIAVLVSLYILSSSGRLLYGTANELIEGKKLLFPEKGQDL